MDECVILLILIVVVTVVIFSILQSTAIVGGGLGSVLFLAAKSRPYDDVLEPLRTDFVNLGSVPIDAIDLSAKKNTLDINAKLVFDGHNLIHQIDPHNMNIKKFNDNLNTISEIITDAFPTHQLHIVLKNPSAACTVMFDKMNKSKYKGKKSSEESIPYFRELVLFSKRYPRITYHLAYAKPDTLNLKSRDDFLVIYLASNGYIVSNDRFRDYDQFMTIKPFKHYSVSNGVIHKKETIKPAILSKSMSMPTTDNQLLFEFVDSGTSGSIHLVDKHKHKIMHLVRSK